MDTGKTYYDTEGNECSIWQMVRREPEWAAEMIQKGERAEAALTEIAKLDYRYAATNMAAYDAVQIARKALGLKD